MNLPDFSLTRRLMIRANRMLFPTIPYKNGYSQEGEDLILAEIFWGRPEGFWIDVGAYHPIRFSNTYLFYERGWRGLNIDATPDSMSLFTKLRPRDINIEAVVSDELATIELQMFSEPALNTIQRELAEFRVNKGRARRQGMVELRTQPLRDLINEHLPADTIVDFLTIDTEGNDLRVLRSNDWRKCRPRLIVVEDETSLIQLSESEIFCYLKELDYRPLAKTLRSLFMIDGSFAAELVPWLRLS